jgi:hypothetical protein
MDPASFLGGRSRETTIRRDALGRWFHDEQPLDHPNLTRAFDRWVDVAEDGRYCLKNDINWAYITLEGPPLFVRSLRTEQPDGVLVRLSDDREELLDTSSLRQAADGALYCDVRAGQLVARFDRHAMQQLESLLGEDAEGVYLALGNGARVRPRLVQDPLLPVQKGPSS